MIGRVDDAGRALLELQLAPSTSAPQVLAAWIDTAFDGELVVPRQLIEELGWTQSAAVHATLADGTTVVLETYECSLDWFGEVRRVEAIANDGYWPLLGIGLLQDYRLTIDYRNKSVVLR